MTDKDFRLVMSYQLLLGSPVCEHNMIPQLTNLTVVPFESEDYPKHFRLESE